MHLRGMRAILVLVQREEASGVDTTLAGTSVYAETTRLDTPELVRQLNSHLGPTLVAALANVRDRKLPHKWAKPDGPAPRHEAERRLRAAHRAWTTVSSSDGGNVARSWFIGANPRLGDESPVMCLREGRDKDVLAAARAFADGLDD